MRYYYFQASHWSRVISLVIAEKSLEPTRHFVDIRVNACFEPAYLRLNPRGVVPTLVADDGTAVWDSMKIARYLDTVTDPAVCEPEASPDAWPWAERLERVRVMHASYAVWVLGQRGENSKNILDDKVDRARQYAEAHPELRAEYERKATFFETFRAEVDSEAHRAEVDRSIEETITAMGDALTSRPYLGGDAWSLADAVATSMLYRLVDLERQHQWHGDEAHAVHHYYQRLRARPSFTKVFVDDPVPAR